jgi:hypothetical protein
MFKEKVDDIKVLKETLNDYLDNIKIKHASDEKSQGK